MICLRHIPSRDFTPNLYGIRTLTAESIPNIRLGTSSWSSEDWVGPFYPPGTPPGFLFAAKISQVITH